jgi:DNA-binding NarL/FixJ family response regulator
MTERPYRIRILVVDDHPAVRCGLRDLLGTYSDVQVIGAAADGPSVLDAAKRLLPDVILSEKVITCRSWSIILCVQPNTEGR